MTRPPIPPGRYHIHAPSEGDYALLGFGRMQVRMRFELLSAINRAAAVAKLPPGVFVRRVLGAHLGVRKEGC